MRCNLKSTRIATILLMTIAFIIGVWCGRMNVTTVVYPSAAEDVIKTVAHVTIRNPNFELLASFPEEDVAYYRQVNQSQIVIIGDTVYTYRGNTAEVTDVSIWGFTIRCDSLGIGDSGTVIRNDSDVQVGYVSQQVGDNLFYCIWS